MPWLIIEKGPEKGAVIEVPVGARLVFGRDASCDVTTADVSCSRRHFGIVEKDGVVVLRDLESTHGTFVNGWRVEKTKLKDGDSITAGETILSFQLEKAGRGLVGKVLGGYQVLERIGRGGMGTVYKARQVALDRIVALKILSPRYSNDKTFINRFFKEAQAAARLNHPNVVQVYDVREEQGLYFISLEYMDRGTVQDLAAEQGQLPIPRVLDIARDAARGLVYAEKKGIVHGDIKPDNLMINADGHIKISDLGLARDAGETVAASDGAGIFGTPHFIAPEQALGKPVDSRADIYSLGATLYRLISGTTPFTGASVAEIVKQQINDEPRPLRELRPDCPQDLADLIAVMMAKKPEERFSTAQELLDALTALGTTGKLESSSRGVRAAIGVLAILAVAIGAFVVLSGNDDEAPPSDTTNGENSNATSAGGPGESQTPSAMDAELARQKLELEVRRKLIQAKDFLIGLKGEGRADDPEALAHARDLFVAARDHGPDTEPGKEAASEITRLEQRIEEIRAANEEAARRAEAEKQRVDEAWQRLESSVEEFERADRFADALSAVLEAKNTFLKTHRAEDWRTLAGSIEDRARRRSESLHAQADAALAAGDLQAARTAVALIVERFNPTKIKGPEFAAINAMITLARDRIDQIDAKIKAAADAAKAADQQLAHQTLRQIYEGLPEAFDLQDALERINAARDALQTDPYRDVLDAVRSRVERAAALVVRLGEAVGAGTLKLRLSGRGLPSGEIVAIDATGLTVKKRSGQTEHVAWSNLDATDVQRCLFRRGVRSPRDRLDAAIALCLAGLCEEAAEILEPLDDEELSDDLAADVAATREFVGRERDAMALFARAKDAWERRESDPNAWFDLNSAVQRLLRQYRDTRTFVLASDGSTPLAVETP